MVRYLILALALTGCAVSSGTFTRPTDLYNPPPEYPFYYDALYADLFWRCVTPEGGGVRVEGYGVSSTRTGTALYGFEVTLVARDAKGTILADPWIYGDPRDADNVTPTAFAISVPATGEGVGYDLRYRFQTPGGNGNGRASRGRGVRLVQDTGAQEIFGTIEDVCSDKYRRKVTPPGS
ncbi:MAG: hypothetical protein V3W05_03915 [candidate division NC10 bacterium]